MLISISVLVKVVKQYLEILAEIAVGYNPINLPNPPNYLGPAGALHKTPNLTGSSNVGLIT